MGEGKRKSDHETWKTPIVGLLMDNFLNIHFSHIGNILASDNDALFAVVMMVDCSPAVFILKEIRSCSRFLLLTVFFCIRFFFANV